MFWQYVKEFLSYVGHKLRAYAEDALEDEVEVEGEADVEEVAATEEEEEVKTTTSPDADTAILFVKPAPTGNTQMGKNY